MFHFSADAPDRKRTACYDVEVDVVSQTLSLLPLNECDYISAPYFCMYRTVR